jgi:hypothetical protein
MLVTVAGSSTHGFWFSPRQDLVDLDLFSQSENVHQLTYDRKGKLLGRYDFHFVLRRHLLRRENIRSGMRKICPLYPSIGRVERSTNRNFTRILDTAYLETNAWQKTLAVTEILAMTYKGVSRATRGCFQPHDNPFSSHMSRLIAGHSDNRSLSVRSALLALLYSSFGGAPVFCQCLSGRLPASINDGPAYFRRETERALCVSCLAP